ncbi:MAG: DUF4249 domain-containing protein [Gemmatimonas sp.]
MRRFMVAAAMLMLAGCERVVTVDLEEGPKRLVIEARLELVKGRANTNQRIRLTTTDAYFSNTTPPAARGAVVQVADNAGAVFPFTESTTEPGIYETTAFAGAVGRIYTLSINYQGDRYQSSEQLLSVAPIDSLYFIESTFPINATGGLRATITFRDPRGRKNFYLWDQLVNGVRILSSDSTVRGRVVISDELGDGQRLRDFQPYDGVRVESGELVTVRQSAISENVYRFYVALSEQASNDGSPFGVAPASLRGNVTNVTSPVHFPLGYFIASEVAEVSRRVP